MEERNRLNLTLSNEVAALIDEAARVSGMSRAQLVQNLIMQNLHFFAQTIGVMDSLQARIKQGKKR